MEYLPLIGEFLGTWLFLLSILASGNFAIIGATMAVIVYLLAKTSGGHVNPAVSLAYYLKGSLSISEFMGYVVAQLLGGTVSYYTYKTFA